MYFEDFQLHAVTDIGSVVIEKEDMLSFAGKYDPLPIHTDEAYAQKTRFGALIAPGVMTFMSIWAKFLDSNPFGDELIAGKSTHIEWLKPVFAGDVLTAHAEVTALSRTATGNGVVEITVTARNQHGLKVLTDVTQVVVRARTAP